MITTRVLSASEFERLRNFGEGFVPDPRMSIAVVAEDEGKLVGRIFLLTPAHIEAPFIIPELRNGILLGQLVQAAENAARDAGARKTFAYAIDEKFESYLSRLGYRKEPFTVWSKELA